MAVVAYLRVSTEKQFLENQREEIIRFAEKNGLSIDRWYMETVSGKVSSKERKLAGLLDRMKPGDSLIITEISRLSRTLLEIMTILNSCIKRGVVLYSTKEGYVFQNDINSKVLGFAFGLMAEIERNLISMRTKEALERLRKEENLEPDCLIYFTDGDGEYPEKQPEYPVIFIEEKPCAEAPKWVQQIMIDK